MRLQKKNQIIACIRSGAVAVPKCCTPQSLLRGVKVGAEVTLSACSMQANISTLQTNLQTNTTSPTLTQVTTTNDLPSAASRVLVQFNSLAATNNASELPQDVADLNEVVNSTFLPNVDTHVLTVNNDTTNASDLVTTLRARDGMTLLIAR